MFIGKLETKSVIYYRELIIINSIFLYRKIEKQSVPICTFLLGTWQVRRLKWKTDLVERLKKRTSHEPFELPEK